MKPYDDPFQPEHIEEQLEWLARNADTEEQRKSAQLIKKLQSYYETQQKQELLARAWKQIDHHYETILPASQTTTSEKFERSGKYSMQKAVKEGTTKSSFQGWTTLAAVIILVFLVGSMAFVLNRAGMTRGGTGSGGGTFPCATTTSIGKWPTPIPTGGSTPLPTEGSTPTPMATSIPSKPCSTPVPACTPEQTTPTPAPSTSDSSGSISITPTIEPTMPSVAVTPKAKSTATETGIDSASVTATVGASHEPTPTPLPAWGDCTSSSEQK
ncbi:hypothetical protein [Tengunoibacter tsumagoiensis]|uniref:hypothetical protein n=1 Tax=Tengunoibacter tsumagoiensis TaxID=2014871 RepID=UPI000F83199D|nr:hypothetical protein [Tengunoibacter tsumagoiensis]